MSKSDKGWVVVVILGIILFWAASRSPEGSKGNVATKGADVITKDIGDATGIHRKR